MLEDKIETIKMRCFTSLLNYVFRLEENASRVVGQNSLTPQETNNNDNDNNNNNNNIIIIIIIMVIIVVFVVIINIIWV